MIDHSKLHFFLLHYKHYGCCSVYWERNRRRSSVVHFGTSNWKHVHYNTSTHATRNMYSTTLRHIKLKHVQYNTSAHKLETCTVQHFDTSN